MYNWRYIGRPSPRQGLPSRLTAPRPATPPASSLKSNITSHSTTKQHTQQRLYLHKPHREHHNGRRLYFLQDHPGLVTVPPLRRYLGPAANPFPLDRRNPVDEDLRERKNIRLPRHWPTVKRALCAQPPLPSHTIFLLETNTNRCSRCIAHHPQTPRRQTHRHPRRPALRSPLSNQEDRDSAKPDRLQHSAE